MNWIETQDELPPENVRVLTCHRESGFKLLYYCDGRWTDYSGVFRYRSAEIQYWCELVAPQVEVKHAKS